MLLSKLSSKAKRIVQFVYVWDTLGASFSHRKFTPYLHEIFKGDANFASPQGKHSMTFMVRSVSHYFPL